jgi:hypothetical protein
MSDGFLSRWSRRKQDALAGRALDEPSPPATLPAARPATPSDASPPTSAPEGRTAQAAGGSATLANSAGPAEAAEPLPTLQDTQALQPTSDFQPFMRQGVAPEVRNAAMKKLFADPHFNVMDGLDIYIDDYSLPDPLPAGMLEKMVGAQLLNLVPPPAPEGGPAASAQAQAQVQAQVQVQALENPDQSPQAQQPDAVVAQSPDSAGPLAAPDTEHDHTDLQLQPDLAPADPQAGTTAG